MILLVWGNQPLEPFWIRRKYDSDFGHVGGLKWTLGRPTYSGKLSMTESEEPCIENHCQTRINDNQTIYSVLFQRLLFPQIFIFLGGNDDVVEDVSSYLRRRLHVRTSGFLVGRLLLPATSDTGSGAILIAFLQI